MNLVSKPKILRSHRNQRVLGHQKSSIFACKIGLPTIVVVGFYIISNFNADIIVILLKFQAKLYITPTHILFYAKKA